MSRILAILLSLAFAATATATLPATDLFNTADGALGAGGDTSWAYNRNNAINLSIQTSGANHFAGTADATADTAAHWTGDTFGTNHCSAATMFTISTNGSGIGQGFGPAVRMDTGTAQKTFVRLIGDSHGYTIDRCNNGTCTTGLVTNAATFVINHTYELCVRRVGANDIYTFTDNGAAMTGSPYTDTSPLSSAFVGAGIAHSSTSTNSTGIDSWSGRNWSGGGTGPIFFN